MGFVWLKGSQPITDLYGFLVFVLLRQLLVSSDVVTVGLNVSQVGCSSSFRLRERNNLVFLNVFRLTLGSRKK